MANLENQVLNNTAQEEKPTIYCRFVDDIFLLVKNIDILDNLRSKFQENSVLKFTYEVEHERALTFLDVDVYRNDNQFRTTVHVKSTHSGDCINYKSIAPEKYKTGVIKTMLHRAYTISSDWIGLSDEIQRLKQLFVNNNFPQTIVEKEINSFLNKKLDNNRAEDTTSTNINLYYRNQMSSQYKQEENNLRKIIDDNITPQTNNSVKLAIYYKNKKLSQMLIRNNVNRDTSNSHVVYKHTCNQEGCQSHQYYVGYTTTTLKQRMTMHAQQGSIREHNEERHKKRIRTAEILETTEVLHRSQDRMELLIVEALVIKGEKPPLNNQREGEVRILKIF